MPQGKLKVKTKLPSSAKRKANKQKKGPAIQRRGSKFRIIKLLIYSNNNNITLLQHVII